MHHTVIRLYDKYELASESPRSENADKVRHQYEFARDNISSAGIPTDMSGVDPKISS